MSFFIVPSFRDLDAQEPAARTESYGLRYGRTARARREAVFPHFGIPSVVEIPSRALPSICFVEGRAC